ncbi:ATP-grasp domain-containing protein [Streptomyces sp. ET3-23]|uniref:ATP-grasp domain-containing protein n=1 Tax=Streptomyces sp. ET3-23 TaxID=2885643 RepID=UPI001D102575|nr:ATP-grasp domain-containing protein [Streptomyces sp. ET3-23]MCC2278571.1 ATP-grasp domain-containing protein [Streptomyces sp. ET3-23]
MRPTDFLARAPQHSTTGDLLTAAAQRRGLSSKRLPANGDVRHLKGVSGAHYFGGPLFAKKVVQDLDVALLEPTDDWLTTLPHHFTLRAITVTTLAEARCLDGPAFVKPPSDKSFPAGVYADGGQIPGTDHLSPNTPVQISAIVSWLREFRLFILDGECRTGSQYATLGHLDAAPLQGHPDEREVRDFAKDLLTAEGHTLPSAAVLDVGLMTTSAGKRHWAVVEANMPWFASCYAADPDLALDVVLRAAGPRARLAAQDQRFCRHLSGT